MIKTRSDRFIEEMEKNNGKMTISAEKAGYSKQYARTRQKTIMNNALKRQVAKVQDALQNKETTSKEVKRLMSEIVGISPENLMKRLAFIANQDKDLSSALKVLAPLVREHGVILNSDDDASKVIVPVINMGFAPVEQGIRQETTQVIEQEVKQEPLKEG